MRVFMTLSTVTLRWLLCSCLLHVALGQEGGVGEHHLEVNDQLLLKDSLLEGDSLTPNSAEKLDEADVLSQKPIGDIVSINPSIEVTSESRKHNSNHGIKSTEGQNKRPRAESRILLLDDGIQEDKTLQDISPNREDDVVWRLRDTSFLEDLAREVLSFDNPNTDDSSSEPVTVKPQEATVIDGVDEPRKKEEENSTKMDNKEAVYEINEKNASDDLVVAETSSGIETALLNPEEDEGFDDYDSETLDYYDDDDDYDHSEEDQEENLEDQDYNDDQQQEASLPVADLEDTCTKDGNCESSNGTLSLRERLQLDLEASFSEPLPSRIRYRLKRKPSIFTARKPTTRSDIGIPDIYEKEVDVRAVPKDKTPPTTESEGPVNQGSVSDPNHTAKNDSTKEVNADQFLPSEHRKFIPLGAIYRSAVEGREGQDDSLPSKGASKDQNYLPPPPPPSGGLRKHLPFRRPVTFKLKRLEGKTKSNQGQEEYNSQNNDHSSGLSTLEKITLNKTPGVAIEYPPVFHPRGTGGKNGPRSPYRRRPGKRRRKNRRRKPDGAVKVQLQSLNIPSHVKDSSSSTYDQPSVVNNTIITEYIPPLKVKQPETEVIKHSAENHDYNTKDSKDVQIHTTTPTVKYEAPNEYLPPVPVLPVDEKLVVKYIPPSESHVASTESTTKKYNEVSSPSGGKGHVPGWLMNIHKSKKHPTPPPGYVPEITTPQTKWKLKSSYDIGPMFITPKSYYEVPSREYQPSNNRSPPKQSVDLPAQKYEPPQNEYLPPNRAITSLITLSQTYEAPQNEYLPPNSSHKSAAKNNVPSKIYQTPKNEYLPPSKTPIPQQDYTVPAQIHEVPQNDYLPPTTSQRGHQQPIQLSQIYETPQKEYLPQQKPKSIAQKYNVPSQTYSVPQNEYLPPTRSQTISQNYRVPSQTYSVPQNEYLPPIKSEIISPKYSVPSQTYSVPQNEYLPPTKSQIIPHKYSVPSQTYSVPQNEYLPPTKSQIIPHKYSVPSQTYSVPQNEYLPPTKSQIISQKYSVPSQTYSVPQNEYLPPSKSKPKFREINVPPQTYETPSKEYLPPVKSQVDPQKYSVSSQLFEAPKSEYSEPNRDQMKNEVILYEVKNNEENYELPPQIYEPPISEYLPPDRKTPVIANVQNNVDSSRAYTPPSIVYSPTPKSYTGDSDIGSKPQTQRLQPSQSKTRGDEPKITTLRPNYNLGALTQVNKNSKGGGHLSKATLRRPSSKKRPSAYSHSDYDIDFDYYLDDYEVYDDYYVDDYDEDYRNFISPKLSMRQRHLIDFNFDIKENDILEYGYIIGIPGIAGIDYPILEYIPLTTFRCHLVADYPGYYADMEAGCQVFHVCHLNGRQDSFLCPNGTIFNQKYFVCDWWYNFSCEDAAFFYPVNAAIGGPEVDSHVNEFVLKPSKRRRKQPNRPSAASGHPKRPLNGIKGGRRLQPNRMRGRHSRNDNEQSHFYL